MTRLCSALVTLVVVFAASDAPALDLYGVDLKVGVRGGPNVAFLPRPVDSGEDDAINPQGLFYGAGWNLGTALQVRAFDIVGLELGWMYTRDQAEATIELEGVSDCSNGPRCRVQEVGARLSYTSHHIPLVLHVGLPTGVARPFVTTGLDFVVARNNREFSTFEVDPFPEDLDPATQGDLIERWDQSVEARYLQNATHNRDSPERIGAIIAGLGLNIAVQDFEIPVEFRLNIYPATGSKLNERGVFAPADLNGYDERVTVQYNDNWNYQLFILFGFDYVIF